MVASAGIELLNARRDPARGSGNVLMAGAGDRHEDVHALGTAGLHRSGEAVLAEGAAHQVRGPHGRRKALARRRIEVEDEEEWLVEPVGAHQRRVELHRALVGKPEQGAPVVAQRVRHLALGCVRPHRHRAHPRRRVLGEILLHEGLLPADGADHRERPVAQVGDEPVTHGVEVGDEVALAGAGLGEERRVEVGEGERVGHPA